MRTANVLSMDGLMFFNWLNPVYWVFLIPGLLLGIWAQLKLSHAYGKYSQVPVDSGMTGAEAAREILDRAGLNNVPVEEVPGHLTDHYDPDKTGAVPFLEQLSRSDRRGRGRGGARSRSCPPTSGSLRLVQLPDGHCADHPIREHGLHGHFLCRHLSGPVKVVLPIIIVTFRGDHPVSTGHVAGGI